MESDEPVDLAVQAQTPPLLRIGTDGGKPFAVNANIIVTGRTCMLGASGSGKSYAVGIICEELCKNGVPFALVDTEGEYSGLKEKYEVVWVADDENADLKWGDFSQKDLAAQAPDVLPLILDVSESTDRNQKIGGFLSALYSEVESRRVPYLIILEEADRFCPQNGERLPIFDEIARRGRKRGMGLMVCTQRPSAVDKNVLSQCGNQLIGKLVIRNDLEAVSQFFPGRNLPKQLTGLDAGYFYALGGLSPEPICIHVRTRETHPGGVTPQFVVRKIKPLEMPATPSYEEPNSPSQMGPSVTPAKEAPSLGIPYEVKIEDVSAHVKRVKSFVIFGQQEVLVETQPVYRDLLELGIEMKTGVLTKRHETKYVLLDSATGKVAEFGKKLVLEDGFERLIGLQARDVEVLWSLPGAKYASVIDVADKMKMSPELVKKSLLGLERRRLLKSSQMGRARVYQRIADMPRLSWREAQLSLSAVDLGKDTSRQKGPNEAQLREVVRGLREDYDLVSVRPFSYPLYRVTLALGSKSRTVWIDGISGDETEL